MTWEWEDVSKRKSMRSVDVSTVLRVRLTPKGGRNALIKYESGVLHARVSAAPVDGAANRALIVLLSEVLRVPRSALALISGETCREKGVRVLGMDASSLEARIHMALADVAS